MSDSGMHDQLQITKEQFEIVYRQQEQQNQQKILINRKQKAMQQGKRLKITL